jgi:tetratricopeptide (TPR) repeat protein
LVAYRRVAREQLVREGEAACAAVLDEAQQALKRARESSGAERHTRREAEARAGLEALAAFAPVLEGQGSRPHGARTAFLREDGEGLRLELTRVLAGALVARARADESVDAEALAALQALRELDARSVELHLLAAELHSVAEQPAEALRELDAALLAEPTHEEALVRRSAVLAELGRLERAAGDLSHALLRRPGHVDALLARARVFLRLDRVDDARTDAQNARSLAPGDPAPEVVLGEVCEAEGDAAQALTHFEAATKAAPLDPEPLIARGVLRLAAGSYEAAGADMTRAEELGGGWRALLGKAQARTQAHQLEAALELLDRAREGVAAGPRAGRGRAGADLRTQQALVCVAQGERALAFEALAHGVAASRTAVRPRVWLARLHLDGGSLEKAQDALGGLSEDVPDGPDLLEARSRLALRSGNLELATSLAERAVAAASGESAALARRALADARLANGRTDAARAACDAAWEEGLRGTDLAGGYLSRSREWVALGAAFGERSLFERAEPLLAAALRLAPRRAPALAAQARLLQGLGRPEEAWGSAGEALTLDPFRPELAELAADLALAGQVAPKLTRATQALQRVMEFHGATGRHLVLLARCQMAQEAWGPALESLDHALRLRQLQATVQELRARVLAALGRDAEAQLAAAGARELGPTRDARRKQLLARAEEAAGDDPQRALSLVNEALTLSDAVRHEDHAAAARLAARLTQGSLAQLQLLAPTLAANGPGRLDPADAVLGPGWTQPLPAAARRRLARGARPGDPVAQLAFALATVYDDLAGRQDPGQVRAALAHAGSVVRERPGALAGHVARAALRIRAGDPLRAARELEPLRVAAESPLVWFFSAEANAASDHPHSDALGQARALGLPEFQTRRQASPYLSRRGS